MPEANKIILPLSLSQGSLDSFEYRIYPLLSTSFLCSQNEFPICYYLLHFLVLPSILHLLFILYLSPYFPYRPLSMYLSLTSCAL